MTEQNDQIKSRERVTAHGEVVAAPVDEKSLQSSETTLSCKNGGAEPAKSLFDEDEFFAGHIGILQTLLRCHSSYHQYKEKLKNKSEAEGKEDDFHIIWATDDYQGRGDGYSAHDQITVDRLLQDGKLIVQPRANKSREEQEWRIRDKAEVFTPAWVCNEQNNLVDEAWFGRPNVFNTVNEDHTWRSTDGKIEFDDPSKDRSWQAYVKDLRLEITCGEAPYLVSRQDAVTGQLIPIRERVGLLDRKLRVVGENTQTTGEWLEMAQTALKSCYGYEWQGDNLFLARRAVLFTFIDYYQDKFGGAMPLEKSLNYAAYIISWNLWQMDGLKMVVPDSCYETKAPESDSLFAGMELEKPAPIPCPGCQKDDHSKHNGIQCVIKDWRKPANKQVEKFHHILYSQK